MNRELGVSGGGGLFLQVFVVDFVTEDALLSSGLFSESSNVSLIALLSLFVSRLGANFLPHLVHINAPGSPDPASLSRPSFLETNFRQQWLAVISGAVLIDSQT